VLAALKCGATGVAAEGRARAEGPTRLSLDALTTDAIFEPARMSSADLAYGDLHR
jgi:hypothetical protein